MNLFVVNKFLNQTVTASVTMMNHLTVKVMLKSHLNQILMIANQTHIVLPALIVKPTFRAKKGKLSVLKSAKKLMGRNGHAWSTEAPTGGKTVTANLVRQKKGLNVAVTGKCQNICDFFHLFVTEDMVLLMVRETTRRGNQVTRDWNSSNETQHTWIDTDIIEMYAFIGLLLLAGVMISGGESLDDLWSSKDGRPIFRATMSEARFKELMRFCRFDNHATRAQRQSVDKLAAIRGFWEMFIAALPVVYRPGIDLTLDEQLVATRGRWNFRQYIHTKPGKYGIKIFWACDSETSYPLKGEVYVGRQPGAAATSNNVKDLVHRLIKPWINTGRSVTMDNYFTSTELAKELLLVRTTIVGTIRKNRADIPPELLPNMQRPVNSSIFCFDGQVTLTSYVPKKNKAVLLLSSMHHDSATDSTEDNKPHIVLHYNATQSGVDNLDHLARIYTCKRKINRWPMCVFFNVLDYAGVAAYVTFTARYPDWNRDKHHRRRLFLRDLGECLVEEQLQRRQQNHQAMQSQVKLAFTALGRNVQPVIAIPIAAVAQPFSRRQHCYLCSRSNDTKVTTTCVKCSKPCCKIHGKLMCNNCHVEVD